jgi:hypothetical protein
MNNFVPPSGLLSEMSDEIISVFSKNLENKYLRIGVIVKVHEIDDKTNISKLLPEYDVITSEQNTSLGQSFVTYSNCISADSLGGGADFFTYKKRVYENEDFKDTYDIYKQDGSIVLLFCIDGHTDKAIIIASMPNVKIRESVLTKEKGLHLEGEYNGLNWKIDKEGSFTVTFKSKTDSLGNPQDEEAGGTFLKIDEKGSVGLDLNKEGDENTSIYLNKTEKDINITSGNNVNINSQSDFSVNSKAKASINTENDIIFAAQGAANITSGGVITIKADSSASINSPSVSIKGDKSIEIKSQNVTIQGQSVSIGPAPAPAVTLQTQFFGTGNLGAPVISIAMGPFSQSVKISS